uniref:Rho-GAP domain-containing protein n=1 Tax=Pseudictyota dubia TaxID=2749911 RepID=A0A7R9VEQ0_9STRA|mmetsp:Transcript_1147/g.1903  ORF Transcript_1147/g.1903 Transcript_1147/m.1903 type:complete len:839 (+) Transcript_1147:176-2692(+)|eukprot:CAMPEP_0197450304 /NCGR_PEP_ID=MMETSP1175-20131217/24785_1 /TAXON_ID=1003142 /ORGANISM="Triceratium dubium, Strain CCMP147" /LENGTH=838 /DNA_ID=CAMNT_0042982687 /DNA_START=155 /DNA_END=2671 /DNA_ORIENTATION=-
MEQQGMAFAQPPPQPAPPPPQQPQAPGGAFGASPPQHIARQHSAPTEPTHSHQQPDPQTTPAGAGGGSQLPPAGSVAGAHPAQKPVDRKAAFVKGGRRSTTGPGILVASRAADEETEDGRIRNREAATKIRDAWIYKQIRARQDEFTQYKQARIFFGTWNVNAKGKDEPLDDWLCSDWGENGEHAPDIVAVGLQEMVDLNAVNVAVDNKSQQKSQHWVERVRTTLNSRRNSNNDPMRAYTLLKQKYLVGLLLCVFVKSPHKQRVKYVHSDSVGVGVMGMMGNKGAVSVRLQFYDSTICITNSHLAAHRENVAGRNADFANIFSKVSYDIGDEAVKEVIRSGSLSQWATGTSSVGIADHDLAFWMGDLNYRVDEQIPTEKVIELSQKSELEELIANDQLNIERSQGRVFQGFEEGVLTFQPTYKYQPGTDLYEQRPDKKLRAPAWCDRILWLAQEPSHVTQLSYKRSELNISDHKPVMGTFAITIKDVVQSKREEVYEEVMKLLDKFENQTLPMVGLDRISLDFGEVRYDQKVTLPIKVTNTGKVVAQFRLVPKLDEVTLCKPWMTVSPTYGMLIPGEQPATLNFTITIDNATAHALNIGREVLEDIIILRLENGRDYYITVTAKYARSCFGMSVDELVTYAEPIRNVPLDPIRRAETQGPNPTAALCVPKELWRIVDAIYEKGLHERDLFTASGIAEEVSQIRECLDTGAPFGEFRIHSMTEVLISFLSNLSSPIVPRALFPTLEIDAQNIQSCSRKFLEELPPIHYNVFVYMISFFREALLYRESNKLSAAKLARICCNCLVIGSNETNPMEETTSSIQRRAGMQLIMLHFLETNSI